MTNTIHNEDFYVFNELRQDIMKYKSLSFYEATLLAAKFFVSGIEPGSNEFEEEMKSVKTLWEES